MTQTEFEKAFLTKWKPLMKQYKQQKMNTMHTSRGYEVHKPDPVSEYNWLKGQIEMKELSIKEEKAELAAKRTAILAEHVEILVSIGCTQEELEQAIVEARLKQ